MNRRLLLAGLPAIIVSRQGHGTTGQYTTFRNLRLWPGDAQGVSCRAQIMVEPSGGMCMRIRVRDVGQIVLPSWYGNARVVGRLTARDREVLLVSFEGNHGTGVSQRLGALIGMDNTRQLRVLGIETLEAEDNQVSTANRSTLGAVTGQPGGFAVSVVVRTDIEHHGRRQPSRVARWRTELPWDGQGVIPAPPPPPGAQEEHARVDRTRAAVADWLAEAPRTDLREAPFEEWGLWNVGLIEQPA
ncbi:hypothetical protein EOD42_12370 [Rhodovarius crocodyli]|uniref:Uncharacterized protein n=1 Tax=Rhodovarius crocodyli TaxID=1979269 RepID=A0A437ME77_9PROT|nr:hypothetical protein [Rhodovarius crocodyli]RVT95926.1 hypothetical protein EOD42_12370 [Rhodovarius crocodyli]